jgi:hypothetical protein
MHDSVGRMFYSNIFKDVIIGAINDKAEGLKGLEEE